MNRAALLAAVAAAGLGVALLLLYKKRFEDEVSGGRPIPVLTAVKDIPFGEVLTEESVRTRTLPERYLEERHIRKSEMSRVIGVPVSRSIRANETVLWSDLAVSSIESRTLAGSVPPGWRAISVPATPQSVFGGLLRPGDRVDVLLTTVERDSEQRTTVNLIQNVLVLAIGQDTGMKFGNEDYDEDLRIRRRTSISLSVTLQQSQVLTHAINQGSVSLVLRHPGDTTVLEDIPETSAKDLYDAELRAKYQRRPTIRRPKSKTSSTPRKSDGLPEQIGAQ